MQNELQFFSRHALKIKDKEGSLVQFVFNQAQLYLHNRLEDQIKRIGRVRVLILKGRQQGCSTYVGARYYHKTTRFKGKATFILSHQANTTDKLFGMTERFYEHTPEPLRPDTKVANRRELSFASLDSSYCIGTAGNEDVGRGGTVQYFHGSEVAFWKNTDGIVKGVLQSVPDLPGTEIILESTANGMGNLFHQKCMDAMEEDSEYELVFIPWFWQDEYRKDLPYSFLPTQEEAELQELFKLDDKQIYWRRMKIKELGSLGSFKQEYPMTVEEAFQTSGNRLINSEKIVEARKSIVRDIYAPKILGVDPGRNKDRSVLVDRQGRHIRWFKEYKKEETAGKNSQWEMRLAGIIANLIDREGYDKVFIDSTKGWGIVDRLHELGYEKEVVGIVFGEKAIEENVYLNIRAEMWCSLRDWFHNGNVNCPDDEKLHLDVTCMPDEKHTSSGLIKMEAKDKIIEIYKKSPDIGDAAALTFALPVRRKELANTRSFKKGRTNKSSLRSMSRVRKSNVSSQGVTQGVNIWE